ncbi:acetyl-coenzyme A synthetase N-terminal domain-containing protein, partial [Celeribacter marinus]
MGYADVYGAWKADPEKFWMQAAEDIFWYEKPSKALFDENAPIYEWFSDGMTNTCYNAVDRHVDEGRGDNLAIMHESPITHSSKGITYKELRDRVAS